MSILFEQFNIKNMKLKNRFVRSATTDGCAENTGHVSDRQISVIENLADGGTGLIITGIAYVHDSGRIISLQNSIADDKYVPGLKNLASAAHINGAKIAVQLFHAGREGSIFLNPQKRLALAPSSPEDNSKLKKRYREIKEEEIYEVIDAFGNAAKRAKEAGFDAVQVHGAHVYLLSQFLSPGVNKRKDKWGGSLENRLRLHREICHSIREKTGDDYPVMIKIGVKDGFEGGLEFAEGKEAAVILAESGYDALEISLGIRGKGYENSEYKTGIKRVDKEGYFRDCCQEIKSLVNIPVMMVGGLRSFELMEEIILKKDADLISLCRPLIKEPDIIKQWENNSSDRKRSTCISCNKCLETLFRGNEVSCVQLKKR